MKARFTIFGIGATIVAITVWMTPFSVSVTGQGQGTAASGTGPSLRTPWGEPDLQGIWTDEFDTPLQRSPRYGTREFFTDQERADLDQQRAALLGRNRRVERGTELDVAGAYNATFTVTRRTGRRTSLIVDPPNGRIPPQTPEAQKTAAAERAYRFALLQSTETCKQQLPACAGGKYDPAPSPRRNELPPRYNTGRINRLDHPEDGGLADRCLADNGGGLPTAFQSGFGGVFRRIVQTRGGITMFYDVGQGQGFQRNIVMNGSPHLMPHVRQWFGDSRGRWEGDTLVVDVTNFSPKMEFMGARENLHLVERWRRTGPDTLQYTVTIEDPTVWTQSWTVKQELTKQNEKENRIYYEPRCHEGNYAFPSMLLAARQADKAYAERRGPHPATKDNASDFVGQEENPFAR
ncbi:MAG: hypothetical protein ACRDF6_05465 [bacterium]